MNTDISFELNQVLTQETRDGLNDFATAGLQAIDYTTYINQITSQISTLAVDSTISTLEGIRDTVEPISVSTGDKSWEQSENFCHFLKHMEYLNQEFIIYRRESIQPPYRITALLPEILYGLFSVKLSYFSVKPKEGAGQLLSFIFNLSK